LNSKLDVLKNLPKQQSEGKKTKADIFLDEFGRIKNTIIGNHMWFIEYLILKSSTGVEDFYFIYNHVRIGELWKFIYKKVLDISNG